MITLTNTLFLLGVAAGFAAGYAHASAKWTDSARTNQTLKALGREYKVLTLDRYLALLKK